MNAQPVPEPDHPAEPRDAWQRPPSFPFSIFFLVLLLTTITATLVTFILPESFSATARIKLERDHPDIPGLGSTGTDANYDPYYIQTEFELMQSELVLAKVIEELDLNSVWGKKYANGERLKTSESLQMLKSRTDLRPVRNTSLIEIRVYSEKAEEAAKVANAIAEAYRDYRLKARVARISNGLRALEASYEDNSNQIRKLEAEVAEAQAKQAAQATNVSADSQRRLDDYKRFGQILFAKIAAEKTDLSLPAGGMVEIVDRAVPGVRPVRPNKPLNIVIGIVLGGVAGLFLACLVFWLQRRAYRLASGIDRTPLPARFRAVVHIGIALTVGVIVGYHCATPLDWPSMITVPLTVLAGAVASAYIELVNVGKLAEPAAPRGNAEAPGVARTE